MLLGRGRSNLRKGEGQGEKRLHALFPEPNPSPCLKGTHREHGGPVLEGAGEPWYPCVVRQTGVTVARRQRRVQERLLRGVVGLGLALLRLRQSRCRSRGGGVASAEFR